MWTLFIVQAPGAPRNHEISSCDRKPICVRNFSSSLFSSLSRTSSILFSIPFYFSLFSILLRFDSFSSPSLLLFFSLFLWHSFRGLSRHGPCLVDGHTPRTEVTQIGDTGTEAQELHSRGKIPRFPFFSRGLFCTGSNLSFIICEEMDVHMCTIVYMSLRRKTFRGWYLT